ncbi:DUF421 domain-containing protein [Maribacter sp. 6B07]|uniref:DUF421 domain-containing protein n=1 Tax=Maribacter dokdonensis TaxID=320912 RepID=A0A1H4JUY8_9FLAO|nr:MULTISPECIES: YetF domain-containing protein [Maribacter]APA63768.1 membrane protein [Maribacter sp. 1_2014MBL_MicDiv]PHN95506.1 DUF421 domain-containing protein [Maribacter sp. 6B07]SEB49618.1 Protein of unknown function [Maribacter dokdonensis]|tara:strand:- start:1616 stop:2137 length:522 start_codon:yes stop_codon:yes gene_type:complete
MKELFNTSWETVMLISISACGIYLAIIVFTRITGKRSFSKMSSFDFAMTVAVGSIIATTILSSSVKMIEGIVGLAMVYLLQISIAFARRNKTIQNLVDNSPLLLMDGEKIIESNLRKARVTESDLRSKLREANVTELSQIKAVIFETTGDISVLHKKDDAPLDLWIMKDVKRE